MISRGLFPEPDQEALRRGFIERFAENDEESYRAVFVAIQRPGVSGFPSRRNG